MTKTYEITIDGKILKIESKTHADIFRQFWNHFMELNLEKTIKTIELAGIRTSENALFVAKNGSKKKNIPLTDNVWIYTHLTPVAMEKAYTKFKSSWEGKIDVQSTAIEAVTPLEVVELEPEQLTIEIETSQETEAVDEPVKNEIEIAKDAMAMEEYGTPFSELTPSMKGKITKKYNQLQNA